MKLNDEQRDQLGMFSVILAKMAVILVHQIDGQDWNGVKETLMRVNQISKELDQFADKLCELHGEDDGENGLGVR